MYYFLARLWCVVLLVLIVVEETNGGGLVVAELKEPALGGTKAVGATRLCVSFVDAVVEAGVPLLLFLDLGLLRAFGREMESEGPREECILLVVTSLTSLTSLTYLLDVMSFEVAQEEGKEYVCRAD